MFLRKKHIHLSDEKRVEVVYFLVQNIVDGKFRHGTIKKAASRFDVTTKTIRRIITKLDKKDDTGHVFQAVRKNRPCNKGRKVISNEELRTKSSLVPFKKRSAYRSMKKKQI